MKKIIILLLFITSIDLFAGTLRLLNIPTYSVIKIDSQDYFNEDKRYLEIELKEKLFSYNIKVINDNFKPYSFSQNISDKKVAVYTLDMEYVQEYFTNIFVQNINKTLDSCQMFVCSVNSGTKITQNTYKFKDNIEDKTVDFTVSRRGYYNETDSYDITKNQKIVISPVSSFGYIGIGIVYGLFPAQENLNLTSGSDRISYNLEDINLYGGEIYYKKNTPYNFFIGVEFNYLTSKESFEESSYDEKGEYSGDPLVTMMSYGVSIGYKWHPLFMEVGLRAQNFEVSKTYSDTTYSNSSNDATPYISLNYMFGRYWAFGVTASSVFLDDTESSLMTVSLQLIL